MLPLSCMHSRNMCKALHSHVEILFRMKGNLKHQILVTFADSDGFLGIMFKPKTTLISFPPETIFKSPSLMSKALKKYWN